MKQVEGGQISSIIAIENSAGAVARVASSAASKYDRVVNAALVRSRWSFRYSAISVYGGRPEISAPRRKLQRNGTSGITPASPGTSPDTARAIPPPWLTPVTTIRSGSTAGCSRAASTQRTASVNTRR